MILYEKTCQMIFFDIFQKQKAERSAFFATHKTPTKILWVAFLCDVSKRKNLDKSTFARCYFLIKRAKIIKFEMEGSIG